MRLTLMVLAAVVGLSIEASLWAAEAPSADKGRQALLEKNYVPAIHSLSAYQSAWKHWGLAGKPAAADYDRLFRERYGLHPAPYANGNLPMGLREAPGLLGLGKGVAINCMICHGGSIFGKSYVGLGNSNLDIQAYFEEMGLADGGPGKTPFTFSNVRGTSEAGGMAVFLLGYREPDLRVRLSSVDLELHDDLCEDPTAWWQLKKKKTMYHTGDGDTRSVRALMQFMLTPLNPPSAFKKAEPDFVHIREYLLSIEAPKYPLPINRELAGKGEVLFNKTCARCHGTYGEKWTYPNRIVPLEEIGTDRKRYDGITAKFGAYYAGSWFGQEQSGGLSGATRDIDRGGYQAPPLDGVWATAPYFHNGCAPTVYHVLNSKARPRIFTRSYRTEQEDYDAVKLGWKIQMLEKAPNGGKLSAYELRKIYDTNLPGRSNGGHTYGDLLSEEERMAVIEYLKTL